MDERTRMINVVVRVDDPFSKKPPLAPGLFVSVDIKGNTLPNAALIPRSALKPGKIVWTVGPGSTLKFTPVRVAIYYQDNVLIISGLNESEHIIISRLRGVTDGMTVEPVSAEEDKD